MLDSVATQQEPSPTGDGADITELVVRDLAERKAAGTKKYGQPLRAFNGRRALVDAYQESIDLTLYLRQQITENAGGTTLPITQILTTNKIGVRLIQKTGGDYMVAAAARVSTSGEAALEFADASKSQEIAGLINYLVAHRHGTPFEHASLTFFVHAPIFVWREWHRHRIGFSYNEESARYKQLDPVFWLPNSERKILPAEGHTSARPKFQMGTDEQWVQLCISLESSYRFAYSTYQHLLNLGYAKEVARACLPFAIYSSCWVTCNPRSLMAFLSLRTHDPDAQFVSYPQAEIETAARACEQIFAEGWPLTYAAFIKNGRVAP